MWSVILERKDTLRNKHMLLIWIASFLGRCRPWMSCIMVESCCHLGCGSHGLGRIIIPLMWQRKAWVESSLSMVCCYRVSCLCFLKQIVVGQTVTGSVVGVWSRFFQRLCLLKGVSAVGDWIVCLFPAQLAESNSSMAGWCIHCGMWVWEGPWVSHFE